MDEVKPEVTNVHIKTNPDAVIADDQTNPQQEKAYPIYKDTNGERAYLCRVVNGKLV